MSNRLPVLAAEIQRAHADVQDAARTAAERAIAAGNALLEAKNLIKHGEWLPFLKDVCIHERTAQRYMALAEGRLGSDTVSVLGGITPALRFLTLRARGMAAFDEAKAEVDAGYNGLEPLGRACDLIAEMVAMFPSKETVLDETP